MDHASHKRTRLAKQLSLLEALVWILAVVVAWWWILSATEQALQSAIYYASVVSVLAGVRAFLGHGKNIITATGLYGLSTGMFIGYSGIILAGQPTIDPPWYYLALASGAGLTAQIGTTLLAWRYTPTRVFPTHWFQARSANWAVGAGLLMLGLAVALQLIVPDWQWWAEASAFSAICVLTGGLMLRDKARLLSISTVCIAATVILYAEFFHAGTGRLLIVALACAIAVIFAFRFQRLTLKIAIVLVIPLALWWMAMDRLALEQGISGASTAGRTGLESMVAPLNVFALMLEALHEHGFTPSYGYNLLSVPALFIPESIWPNQPRALGYEVVRFDAPELYGDGIFSTVVSSTGEAIYNFGWWGLALIIVVAAIVLRLLDGFLLSRLSAQRLSVMGLLGLVFAAMLAGAIADYTWSGVHTYAARMIARLPAFLLIVTAAWLTTRIGFNLQPRRQRATHAKSRKRKIQD